MAYVEVFSRCVIGVVFLFSAASKLPVGDRFRQFSGSLTAMKLLPERLVVAVAAVVAAAEVAVPVLLLAPLPARTPAAAGFALATVLLAGFAVAIAMVLRRGVQASCRCFGGSRSTAFRRHHVVRNIALVAVAVAGFVAVLARPAISGEVLIVAVAPAVVVALLTTRLDDLVELFSPAAPVNARRR